MPTPTKHFRERIEDALAAHITTAAASAGAPMDALVVETRSGSVTSPPLPLCTISCEQARSVIPEVHLYQAELTVTLRTPLDVTLWADHTAILAWLELQLKSSAAIVAALTAGDSITGVSSTLGDLGSADSDDYREDRIALSLTVHDF